MEPSREDKKRLKKEKKAQLKRSLDETEDGPADNSEPQRKKPKQQEPGAVMEDVAAVEEVESDEARKERKRKKKERKEKEQLEALAVAEALEAGSSKKQSRKGSKGDSNGEAEETKADESEEQPKKQKKKSGKGGDKVGKQEGLYYEAESLADFSEAEIEAFRETIEVAVAGEGTEYPHYKPARTFAESGLPDDVLTVCAKFDKPTPIQSQAWPMILSGRDVVGVAETGSGKTMAFSLPAIVHIKSEAALGRSMEERGPIVLVLAPTRELAVQSAEVAEAAGSAAGIKTLCIYGGVDKMPQINALKKGVHFVVATPGRLLGLVEEGALSLDRVTFLTLDEADRMLDLGFIPDIRSIVSKLNKKRQTLMFTATWPPEIQKLGNEFLTRPARITVGKMDLGASRTVTHIVEVVDNQIKDRKLDDLLKRYHKTRKNRIIIFCLYKKEAARMETALQRKGWNAVAIHGDKGQGDRSHALESFKSGEIPLLVATDVAARGLDIPNVEYVINFTFPLTVEDYVHRCGRTGRAGKTGIAHTFFNSESKHLSGELINVLKQANQDVPEDLLKFGTHTKKKEHGLYGAFFKADDKPMKAATKITFDEDE